MIAQATERASQMETLAETVREEQQRIESIKADIVNAKDALLAVDAALARMPYEVVDDFTKRNEFDAYERAVKQLKRFATP